MQFFSIISQPHLS